MSRARQTVALVITSTLYLVGSDYMLKLTFNAENHQYFLDGFPIPSVSEIIKPLHDKIYKNIDGKALEIAADKGVRVHRAIEFMSKYKLNKFDEDITGYIEAYKKFRNDNPSWKLLYSELRTYNKALLYGMTIDEIYKTEKGIVICDLKTTSSTHLGAWSVQLSAYKAGFESQYKDKKVEGIYILLIFKDGKYKLYKLEDNFSVFLSCLEIYRFEV